MAAKTTLARFLSKVDVKPSCRRWRGAATSRGYGLMRFSRSRLVRVHRFAYVAFVGPIPDGLELDHVCRNKLCCNPDHLEVVTHSENIRRWHAARRTEAV
jgi:hypothetical protein